MNWNQIIAIIVVSAVFGAIACAAYIQIKKPQGIKVTKNKKRRRDE